VAVNDLGLYRILVLLRRILDHKQNKYCYHTVSVKLNGNACQVTSLMYNLLMLRLKDAR